MVEERKQRKASTKPWLALAVVVVAIAIAYSLLQTPQATPVRQALGVKTAAEALAERFVKSSGVQFLSYSDPEWGFELSHPVGYRIKLDQDYSRVRLNADHPLSSSEVIDIVVAQGQKVTPADFEEIAASFNSSDITLKREGVVGSRQAYFLNYKLENPFTGEVFEYRQAFINACTAPDGREYATVITAGIPEALAADVQLADYMISTFRC